ncbi:peptidase M23B [Trichodesmium erythraeum IMS101]|uniref:Peptidase M23B n=1 Tax=Trichodesmium erythraeum (strain IMS101) TaxID=203124 RepID=Q10W26_TRIEI
MSDILGDFSNFEQDLSNLILIGDKQENFDDGQRWTSGIEPTGNNSKLKVEEFNTGGDEPSQPLQGQKFFDLGELNHLSASNSPPGKKDPLVGEDNEAVVKKSDNLINPNPINRRSGNSRNRADNIGTLSSSSSFTGFVGTTDTNDYYRFYLSGEREFNLTLNGLSGDADVRLLNSSGGTISSSTKGGSSSESISETLNSGTYYIRVYPMSGVNTNYNLNIEATSSSSDEEVNITSPSSRTSIEPGERYNIRWTDNFRDNVKLELYKGSSRQQTIARSTSSDGSYSWRAPTSLSSGTNYRIKIRNVNDSSVYDYSSYFTIEPDEPDGVVNITSPSSSTSIEPGERYNIRWTDNFRDNVKLELYKGSSRQQTIARSTSSDGSYSWRAPTSLSSGTNYRIKIRNVNDSSVYDYSSYFTIEPDEPDEKVNITSPSSSTSIEPGERYNIRWTDNFRDNVKLELYKGSSRQRTIARSTSSDGSYSWRAPTSLSSGTNYRIKIRNVNDSSVYDYSSYFTIKPDEEVNITSPSSSTSIEPGESYTIRWTDNFSDNVKLDLYKGSSWQQTIASSTSSDGSYSWRVPTSLSSGTNYNIKIRNVNDSSVDDYSNSFTIQSTTWPPSVTKDLKTYTGREEYSGYVGNDDYYKFSVDSPGYLQFALRGMSADANLQLLNSSGKVLESSSKSGNSDEYANENLGIGTYYMRVYGHNGADTNYRLVLNLDKAKNDRSNARWLGELAGQRKEYKDFIGTSSGDQYDYYKFTVQEPRFLEYALRDLTAPADIDILNSSGARITPKENDKDNHRYNLHETMGLQAGTYYARVTAPTDSSQQTNYKLVLNLKGEYKPLHSNPTESNPLKGFQSPVRGERWYVSQSPGGSYSHTGNLRYAIDISIPGWDDFGEPIYAMRSGTVKKVVDDHPDIADSKRNNLVEIQHENGYVARYWHLQQYSNSDAGLQVGQKVDAGQMIGRVGNSGFSTGPHLHVDVVDSSLITRPFEIEGIFDY